MIFGVYIHIYIFIYMHIYNIIPYYSIYNIHINLNTWTYIFRFPVRKVNNPKIMCGKFTQW